MKVGGAATGDEFFGRDQELKELWHYLKADHILFPGVRRLGKTSILKRLEEQAAQHGFMAQWLDVSGVHSLKEFTALLDRAFPEHVIKRFFADKTRQVSGLFKGIRKIGATLPEEVGGVEFGIEFAGGVAPEWQKFAGALHARLRNQNLLILLDEFPVMLERLIQRDRQEAEQLLAWLRIWRQSPGDCRFVFTGSIGLQYLLERHGLAETMNDCFAYVLGPYSRADAIGHWNYFAPVARQISWQVEEPVIDHALKRVGWLSPYFLSLLLDECMSVARDRQQECAVGAAVDSRIEMVDVDKAYENLLAKTSHLHHWENRLKDDLSKADFQFCEATLSMLSRDANGMTLTQLHNRLERHEPDFDRRAERLQELLARLTDEGYTGPPDADGRIRFLSFPLRDWWSRNHV